MDTWQNHRRTTRATSAQRSLRLMATIGVLGACSSEPSVTASSPDVTAPAVATHSPKESDRKDLATLRASTARYHRFAAAERAGYTFLFMNMCMDDQTGARRGAMGLHYVNPALLDGKVDVATPEALLYEPEANGKRRLVAVEYVIPKAAWTSAAKPRLFGRDFTLNAFDLWALHVWVWKANPSGLYADWNPSVSCRHSTATPGSH